MKKVTKLVVLLAMLLGLVGCGGNKITGTWKSEVGLTYTFNSNGTGSQGFSLGDMSQEFTYTLKDDELQIVTTNEYSETVEIYLIKIENNQLKMASKTDGSSLNYLIYNKVEESKKDKNASAVNLTVEELETLVNNTLYESNDFAVFSGAGHVDWNDFYSDNEGDHYAVVADGIKSLDDVRNKIATTYSKRTVEDIMGRISIFEKDGKLYTNTYGIGGIGDAIKQVSAKKDNDSYYVTLHIYGLDWETGQIPDVESSSQTYPVIYEDGRWVFDDVVYSYFNYLTDDVSFSVE